MFSGGFGWLFIKNAFKLSDHGTHVKYELMKWADFLHADTNYSVGMLKNGGDLLDHGAIKSGVLLLHKSFHESRRLIEWFLHADSDWKIFGLAANLLYIFRRIPPEVFLGKGVLKICSKFTGEHA